MTDVLWAMGFAGHLALVVVLVAKRLWREFPVFTAMTVYQLLRTIVLFVIHRDASAHAYFVAYWVLAFLDYGFQVGVIFEIARTVLRPTGSWVRDARKAFLWWSALGTVLALGIALTVAPPGVRGVDLWEARTTIFTSLLTCELFLAMSASANRLGLPWRSHVMAIGQGLTLWAAVALVGDLAHVIMGWSRTFVAFDYVQDTSYLAVLLFWTVALWLPERAREPLSPEMQQYLLALHRRVQYDLERVRPADKPS